MAEVGAVYEITPAPRTARDILPASNPDHDQPAPAPVAERKGLSANG